MVGLGTQPWGGGMKVIIRSELQGCFVGITIEEKKYLVKHHTSFEAHPLVVSPDQPIGLCPQTNQGCCAPDQPIRIFSFISYLW